MLTCRHLDNLHLDKETTKEGKKMWKKAKNI